MRMLPTVATIMASHCWSRPKERNMNSKRLQTFLWFIIGIYCLVFTPVIAQGETDGVVVTAGGSNTGFANSRQLVRTSTGRLYYFNGNAGHTAAWDGWVEAQSSVDGASWSRAAYTDQWYASSAIGAAIDAGNVVHVVTFDWNQHPYYQRLNTADSLKGDNSWEGPEVLDSVNAAASGNGKCAIAIDANGVPHLVYSALETYKGKTYSTVHYANKVGGTWHNIAVWPKESRKNFSGSLEIAVGPDNVPYILTGTKILRGNANNPSAFDTAALTGAYSIAMYPSGAIAVAASQNGNYGYYSHDSFQAWSTGWSFTGSGAADSPGILLVDDSNTLYKAFVQNGRLWLQKGLENPFQLSSSQSGIVYDSVTVRWSFYNNEKTGTIDVGTRSWNPASGNTYYYFRYDLPTSACFSVDKTGGAAPLTVHFTDISRPGNGTTIVARSWDFDGDGIVDSTQESPSFTYIKPGKYSVNLTVTDSAGGASSAAYNDFISVSDSSNLSKAVYMTRLRSITAADRNMQDVTSLMTDGLLTQGVDLSAADNNVVSVQLNEDARNLYKLTMRFYINAITGNPVNTYAYIMPYYSDLNTTPDSGLAGRAWIGWNVVDLTPIMHRMDGFGVVKFRISPFYALNGFSISEINLTREADSRQISVAPQTLDYGTVIVTKNSAQTVTVTNTGTSPLSIANVSPPSQPFLIVSNDCPGQTLAPNASCNITVSFAPSNDGKFVDAIEIDSDDADNPSKYISLQGTAQLALTGAVTDVSTGRPLNNITVQLTDSAMNTFAATTDSSGQYTILGVTPGGFTAEFSRTDYVTQTVNGAIYQAQLNNLDVQLAVNYAAISGTVTDQTTGVPLSGVKVSVALSGIISKDPAEIIYTCNGNPLTAADYSAIAENDGNKFSCPRFYTGSDYTNPTMQIKARNPYGVDPFTFRWNGIGALYDTEYLAQEFKPTQNGRLTRVSLYLPGVLSQYVKGTVHVLLKSKLGGDRGTYLAMSNYRSVAAVGTGAPSWIDFDFLDPPAVVSGQEYYLEINGTFFEWIGNGGYLYKLNWSNSDAYTIGRGYSRDGGLWLQAAGSLAFRTYVDGLQDIVAAPSTASTYMYGGDDASVSAAPYLAFNIALPDSDGYDNFNGDDLTGEATVSAGLEQYYDQNGWVTVKVGSHSVWSNNLVTDQFRLSFNRTFTTETDANGAYSLPSLFEGNYTITFEKAGRLTETSSGSVIYGQKQRIDAQLTLLPPAALTGTVRNNFTGATLGNVSVTVTDGIENHLASTDVFCLSRKWTMQPSELMDIRMPRIGLSSRMPAASCFSVVHGWL